MNEYISDRKQFVCIDKNSVTISRGVPHGSVLGPLLFLIYMLPLGQIIKCHVFYSYAKDTHIYFAI